MQKDIRINGKSFTAFTPVAGYSVSYVKVQGDAGGTVLTGKRKEDVIAIKAVVTVPFRPLLGDESEMLISEIQRTDYPTLYYFDKKSGMYRTINAICSEPDARYVGDNAYGQEVWIVQPLIFEEA